MRHFSYLTLALTAVTIALLTPAAHAQGANLQGHWTDPSGAYLATVGEGVPVNPPAGGGGGAWIEYQANVTYADGSALMTTDGVQVGFTITAQLHGNAATGFMVEYTYVITADGIEADRGGGHLNLINNQNVLDGSWTSRVDGSTGRLVLTRLPN
jgi:hypothetical protein